jgi:hypothetical protein
VLSLWWTEVLGVPHMSLLVNHEFSSKARSRLVEPETDSVGRAAQDLCRLGTAELVPQHEAQYVSVREFQTGNGGLYAFMVPRGTDRFIIDPCPHRRFALQAHEQTSPPPVATLVTTQDPSGYSKEPQSILWWRRYLSRPSPGSSEDLSSHIQCVFARAEEASKDKCVDRRVVGLVKRSESMRLLVGGSVTPRGRIGFFLPVLAYPHTPLHLRLERKSFRWSRGSTIFQSGARLSKGCAAVFEPLPEAPGTTPVHCYTRDPSVRAEEPARRGRRASSQCP